MEAKLRSFGGRAMSAAEVTALRADFPSVSSDVFDVLQKHPLVGAQFSLRPEADLSGIGADVQGMDVEQMRSEAREAFPGKLAVPLGYFPIGMCLIGSGDPYFLRVSDLAV